MDFETVTPKSLAPPPRGGCRRPAPVTDLVCSAGLATRHRRRPRPPHSIPSSSPSPWGGCGELRTRDGEKTGEADRWAWTHSGEGRRRRPPRRCYSRVFSVSARPRENGEWGLADWGWCARRLREGRKWGAALVYINLYRCGMF